MDKNIKINSPRSIKVCKTNGIEPNELYFIDYSEYLNKHPEISNLPDDIKKYRFHLIERFRLKTIKMIKEKRQELIKSKQNKYINESGEYPPAKKRLEDKFNFINDFELKRNNMTFSEKMGSMYQKERENINRLKKKQKQNIEFMIENRMKAELINYNNIEKDRKLKENFEKKKKENFEKNFINKKIMEEKEQRRIFNVKEMMRRRVFKISTKHELIDKRRNKMLEEKKKYREFLLRKRTEELMKIYNHRSQLDLFRQEQEKKLIKQKLNNEEKEKKLENRIKYLKQKRDEISFKKREKSEEIFLKTLEKKDQHLSQLIQKVNKKHADNLKKMQEYYKELDIKKQAEDSDIEECYGPDEEYTKYRDNGLFTKELDIRSLIFLYFLLVFNFNLNYFSGLPSDKRKREIQSVMLAHGVDNPKIVEKIDNLFRDDMPNEYIDEFVDDLTMNYNLYYYYDFKDIPL